MKTKQLLLKTLLLCGDLILILFSLKIAQWARFGRYYDIFSAETGASLLTLIIFPVTFYIFDLYTLQRSQQQHFIKRIFLAMLVASPFLGILFYVLPQFMFGRGVFLILLCSVLIFCSIWRYLLLLLLDAKGHKERILLVGSNIFCHDFSELIKNSAEKYNIIGHVPDGSTQDKPTCPIPLLGTITTLEATVRETGTERIIIDNDIRRNPALVRLLLQIRFSGITIQTIPDFCEELAQKIPVRELEDDWLLFAKGFHHFFHRHLTRLKRISDCLLAALLLIILSPLILLIAIAVKLDSPGSILFLQQRIGRHGKPFNILKFRSMNEQKSETTAQWAEENDSRITRVGRLLRPYRLDELPQLFNVLRGEMSLIGPRPEQPEFVEMLERKIPYYALRHVIRPGITGWAQIMFHYGSSVEDARHKLEYDLYYIKNLSPLLDLKIFLKTLGVILVGEGGR